MANILNLIAEIGSQEGLTPAQIKAMQATSRVESGLDPTAVGDNGTSYGLFQHHVGGAGGTTHAQAKRYLDPVTSITERARQFKRLNIRGGRGAAALQRPADPAGYAVKVNNALKGLGGVSLNAPVVGAGPSQRTTQSKPSTSQAPSFAQSYLKGYLGYDNDPVISALYDSFYAGEAPQSATGTAGTAGAPDSRTQSAGSALGSGAKGRLGSYQDIEGLARQWGLSVQGDVQRAGGKHSAGSPHYAGRALDLGDATNDPKLLKAFAKHLARNAGMYGINDIWYTPLGWSVDNGSRTKSTIAGHSDHLHVDVR